jgi:hypothetical protein
MAERKAFPLRLEPAVYEALQRWAGAEMRSVNAQIEFVLRQALKQAGRLPRQEEAFEEKQGVTPDGDDNSSL